MQGHFKIQCLGFWIFIFAMFGMVPVAQALDPVIASGSLSSGKYHALEDYRGLNFLFVPGYLYDPFTDLSKDPGAKKWHIGEYFYDVRKALKTAGVGEQVAEMNSEDSIYDNAEDLACLLSAMEGPVVLVSHSKGGLEALEMFLKYPELRKKVVLWVSLQTPFYGSQIADTVYGNRFVRDFAKKMLEDLFEGNIASLEELRTSTRKKYMEENKAKVLQLVHEMPVISLGSWITPEDALLKQGIPSLLPLQQIMRQAGAMSNDGLVELSSSRLPRSRLVRISNMDHTDAVMPFPGRTFDRISMLKMLLDLEYERLMKAKKSE